MTKRMIVAIASLMATSEFLVVALYLYSSEHDLAFSLILGIPSAFLMFVVIGALLTIVFYNRRQ